MDDFAAIASIWHLLGSKEGVRKIKRNLEHTAPMHLRELLEDRSLPEGAS